MFRIANDLAKCEIRFWTRMLFSSSAWQFRRLALQHRYDWKPSNLA